MGVTERKRGDFFHVRANMSCVSRQMLAGVGYARKRTAATPEGSGFTSGAVALHFCLLSRLLQMLLCGER